MNSPFLFFRVTFTKFHYNWLFLFFILLLYFFFTRAQSSSSSLDCARRYPVGFLPPRSHEFRLYNERYERRPHHGRFEIHSRETLLSLLPRLLPKATGSPTVKPRVIVIVEQHRGTSYSNCVVKRCCQLYFGNIWRKPDCQNIGPFSSGWTNHFWISYSTLTFKTTLHSRVPHFSRGSTETRVIVGKFLIHPYSASCGLKKHAAAKTKTMLSCTSLVFSINKRLNFHANEKKRPKRSACR